MMTAMKHNGMKQCNITKQMDTLMKKVIWICWEVNSYNWILTNGYRNRQIWMNILRRISKWFVVGIVLVVMNGDRDFKRDVENAKEDNSNIENVVGGLQHNMVFVLYVIKVD
jgi:hypothetical protein